jgi:pyridoxamine 5'-phosphate oxidase-like protein
MRWDEFTATCPDLAGLARERFEKDQVVMLGTIRADGRPRLSPCEVDFAAGRVLFGMMWQSPKAHDLLRDARLTVHSVPSDKTNSGGDVKLYGVAVDEREPGLRAEFCRVIQARIDWQPAEPYHLFSLDVAEAAFIRFTDEFQHIWRWSPPAGLSQEQKPNQ